MDKYINTDVLKHQLQLEAECGHVTTLEDVLQIIDFISTADVMPVKTVAQILNDCFRDACSCNYFHNDEWLPAVCDSGEICEKSNEPLYCWKQFLKHSGERSIILNNGGEDDA